MLLPESTPIAIQAVAAFAIGTLLAIALGKPAIRWLTAQGLQDGEGRKASDTLNEMNAGKQRTPTMGGLFIMLALVLGALVVLPFDSFAVWVVVAAVLATAGLGAFDDWAKLKRKGRDGIRGRTKLFVQTLVAAVAVWAITSTQGSESGLWIPILGAELPLGVLLVPFGVLVTVGTSNAVNLSDGLDGLAGGMLVLALLAFAGVSLVAGNQAAAEWLMVPYVENATEFGLLSLLAAGAVLGFLWYNVHPAQVFMGDTGSLALGTLLGLIAVAVRQELLLVVIGAMFVAEALSVMLQVGYFKATKGKRIFRCAPLHHHFQFGGMSEVKVTLRFWLLAGMFAMLGLFGFGWGAATRGGEATQAPVAGPNPTLTIPTATVGAR